MPNDQVARKKVINYSLSTFSFNCLPVNYIEVVEDTENRDNVRITQKCYIKAGKTYFSRSRTPFSTIPEGIHIQNMGLVSTSNMVPHVLRKRANKNNKLSPYTINEISPLSSAYITSTRKRKQELEELDTKRRKIEYFEKSAAIKEEYIHLLEKEEKMAQLRKRLEDYFHTHWKNLDQTGEYKVSAFTVNNKGKYTYVGVLAEKDGNKEVFYVKGRHKSMFISVYNNREELIKDGYVIIPYNGMELISLPTEEPFVEFITNGLTTYQSNTFTKIEKLKFYTDAWKNNPFAQEDVTQINNITMQEINDHIKFKDCHRLEEIAEGTELLVIGIKEVIHRKKLRFILQLENINMFYCSNYWLERELVDMDLSYRIKIKIDILKHTPSRNKERHFVCNYCIILINVNKEIS